jgi:hypothetical protein
MWQALLVVAMEVSLLILQRELFKILTEYLHLCPHLLEWVQLKDVAGENCHPLRDPDPRPFITWVSRVQGAPTPLILIWIQLATEQVKGHTIFLQNIFFALYLNIIQMLQRLATVAIG